MYSADAVGALWPFIDAAHDTDTLSTEVARLLAAAAREPSIDGEAVAPVLPQSDSDLYPNAARDFDPDPDPDSEPDPDSDSDSDSDSEPEPDLDPDSGQGTTPARNALSETALSEIALSEIALVETTLTATTPTETAETDNARTDTLRTNADLENADPVGLDHIVFVDANVPDADVVVQRVGATGATVVVIEEQESGLLQVARTLAEHDDLAAIHIFSHGESGALHLGNASLDTDSVAANASGIARWGEALQPGGDLLIYGCDVGEGRDGRHLVSELARLSGADIAASDDATGQTGNGGNWTLEVTRGMIDAAPLDEALLGADWEGILGRITIVETRDEINAPSGLSVDELRDWQDASAANRATLRDAILASNRDPDADTINLGAGTFLLERNGLDDDARAGDLDILGKLDVIGVSRPDTTIEMGGPADRVFQVQPTGELLIRSLSVEGGNTDAVGGGIHVSEFGRLTLDDVMLSDNRTTAEGGGIAVAANAVVDVTGSLIEGNFARSGAGVHLASDSLARIENTEIADNTASGNGGGIRAGTDLVLSDVHLRDNSSGNNGGALHLDGDLTATRVLLERNTAGLHGGAIHAAGDVGLIDVQLTRNVAELDGGALYLANAGGSLDRVTFELNRANDDGGALHKTGSDPLTISNTTFSGNSAAGGGGGIRTNGPIDIVNSTFHANGDSTEAGAVFAHGGTTVTLRNSAFSENISGGEPGSLIGARGEIVSLGYNVFSDRAGITLLVSDRESIDPRLEALAPGTGFVATHRPAADSPLISAGGKTLSTTDASGEERNAGISDIGAHESLGRTDVIYYGDEGSSIFRVGTDLTSPQELIDDATFVQDVAVDLENGRLYWLEEALGEQRLGSADLDGSDRDAISVNELLGFPSVSTTIAIDSIGANLLIGSSLPTAGIHRFPLASLAPGKGSVVVDSDIGAPVDMTVAGRGTADDPVRVLWLDDGTAAIPQSVRSASLSGGAPNVQVHRSFTADEGVVFSEVSVTADIRKSYFSDNGNNLLHYLDAGDDTLYSLSIDPFVQPMAVAVGEVHDELYWSGEDGAASHGRYNVDTESIDDVHSVPSAIQASVIATTLDTSEAPIISTPGTLTVSEREAVMLAQSGLSALDDYASNREMTWHVSLPPRVGVVEFEGNTVESFTHEALLAGHVNYRYTGPNTGTDDNDELTLFVDDGTHDSAPVTLDIDKRGVNTAPYLPDGPRLAISVGEGLSGVLTPAVISAADDDLPADTLTYTVAAPANGIVHREGAATPVTTFTQADIDTGELRYTHDGGTTTADSLMFTIRDGRGGQFEATVEVSISPVNDSPTLTTTPVAIRDGESIDLSTAQLQSMDEESRPDGLTYTFAQPAGSDSLSVDLDATATSFTHQQLIDGLVTYEHPFEGTSAHRHSIALTLADENGAETPGTLSVDVSPFNADAPTAIDDEIRVNEAGMATALTDGATSVLANDSDPQGPNEVLRAEQTRDVQFGTLTLNTDGSFLYQHDGGEERNDSFQYVTVDSAGQRSSVATVTIEIDPVNDPPGIPQLIEDSDGLSENVAGDRVGRVIVTDPDPGDRPVLAVDDARFIIVGDTLRLADGESLDAERELSVSLTVTATDESNAERSATFEVAVKDVADGPVAREDDIELEEGGTASSLVNGAITVLDNDDPGSGGGQVELVEAPAHGDLSLEADGTFLYEHDGTQTTKDSFRYVVRDSSGQVSAPATVSLAITNINTAPYAIALTDTSVAENVQGATIGMLSARDDDIGDTISFSLEDPRFVIVDNRLRLADGESLDFEHEATVRLVVRAVDAANSEHRQDFLIRVIDANDAPVAADAPDLPALPAETPFALAPDLFADPDRDILRFTAMSADGDDLPDWLVFDETDFSLTVRDLRPSEATNEANSDASGNSVTVRLTADDGRGGS